MESTIILTNAPEAYDYRYVKPVLPVGVLRVFDRPVRMVRIDDPADAAYQQARYQSGLYIAVRSDEISDDDCGPDPDFDESVGVVWPERD